jgi:dolichol-phosphate mannosyltransferase
MIWILLPAYNEGESLPKLLPKLIRTMGESGLQHKIVVVNDGSTDNTADILAQHQEKVSLEVIAHPINRGLGETERDGFEYIAMRCDPEDIIVRVEGDDTHEPEYVFTLLQKLDDGYDVVNTSRFQPGGGQIGVNNYRTAISRAANTFMHMMFRISGVKDYSCGYRAYRASVIQDAIEVYGNNFLQLRGLGFTSTLEIIIKLNLLGCRFAEVPFVLRYDQKESGSKMVSSITTLGYLIMALLYHWPFGGWKRQYRDLATLYKQDHDQAMARFSRHKLQLQLPSRISI